MKCLQTSNTKELNLLHWGFQTTSNFKYGKFLQMFLKTGEQIGDFVNSLMSSTFNAWQIGVNESGAFSIYI